MSAANFPVVGINTDSPVGMIFPLVGAVAPSETYTLTSTASPDGTEPTGSYTDTDTVTVALEW
jgi:hypothetical protein